MIQELMLADDLFEGIDDGTKQNTIRYGKRNIVPGVLRFVATDDNTETRLVEVTNVSYVRTGDITNEKAQSYGYYDKEDLIDVMRYYYPTIDDENDDLTVIEFRHDPTWR